MTKGSNTKKNGNGNTRKRTQKGGFAPVYQYSTATASPGMPQVRSFTLTSPTQPYPLEGAPMFPPSFMTDGSCNIL